MARKDKKNDKGAIVESTPETEMVEIERIEQAATEEVASQIAEKKVLAAKKAAASKKVRDRKRGSLLKLLVWAKETTSDKAIMALIRDLTPGERTQTVSAKNVLYDLFMNQEVVHEDGIFTEFKLGRTEMKRHIISLIKSAKTPDHRLWVNFDPTTGNYARVGSGPEAPTGWTGYLPVTIADMEITD